MASISARTERNVGTEGGGMDQAIAFLATKGCAKFIDFQPLRCHDVRLPRDAAFVIAHSLVTINKAAGSEYNTRVVECRLAAQVIAKHEGYEWKNMRRLGDLEAILPKNISKLDGLKHLLLLVEKLLHEEAYTKEEILQNFGINEEELVKSSLSANTTHLKTFKLKQRAAHVYSEAMRVLEFEQECLKSQKEDFNGDGSNRTLERLGMLMNSSHSSLRDLYECSHPQMDLLVQICQEKCFGARLTGAGWGGCAVALTTAAAADEFVEHLKKRFYIGQKGFKEDDDFQSVIFLTSLNSGASVYSASNTSSQDPVIGNHSNGI
ncbi:hypothetical protein J437_LFUL004776 [Ladona fulva]|uniref:GHMP kinase C-terminal domain-containing protein n=1 Tax=Ladona fulva TaxID=123851 RepID=A0A8K0NXZ7_LADFU|nr:hypothetical protein J437_LFUL004776 [Ladona fulva]